MSDFWEGYVPEPMKPAQQEPVAWAWRAFDPDERHYGEWGPWKISDYAPPRPPSQWFQVVPLPSSSPPAQRTWVGLTDEEMIGDFKGGYQSGRIGSFVDLVKAIEAKLKEKNT